jgi:hypothetical protein
MKTIRVFHLIEEEMEYFKGPENFFCKHVPDKFQRIVNIRLNTERMSDKQKDSLRSGNLPQPWFPKMIDPGSKIYFHYRGCLVAYGVVEETMINYPNGNPRNPRISDREGYELYPFSLRFKKGTFECWNHEDMPWDNWIRVINESGRHPNKRAYTKLNDEEDSKIMKLIPKKKVCQW